MTPKEKLVSAGIQALKNYGYSGVTADNITSDPIYSAFFKEMLLEAKGGSFEFDQSIDELLKQIKDEGNN